MVLVVDTGPDRQAAVAIVVGVGEAIEREIHRRRWERCEGFGIVVGFAEGTAGSLSGSVLLMREIGSALLVARG